MNISSKVESFTAEEADAVVRGAELVQLPVNGD
jgi:hypothetical protein